MDCDIMPVGFGIMKGTGRTYCRLCFMAILEGEPVIYISGYRASGQVHILPEDCEYLHQRLLEMDVIE